MATVASDFVDVQLTDAAVAMIGKDGSVRITAAHMSYQFMPGTPVRVLTSEWAKVLSREMLKGQVILEVAAPVAASAKKAASSSAKTQLATLQAEEAALESQIAKEGS